MQSPPVCYRHPSREAHVRCTRCERPICPECMHPASVGFHCPDDVAEGARSGREARTTFGGRLSGDTSRVSIVIIGLCVAVYVLGALAGTGELQLRFGNLAGPVLFSTSPDEQGVAAGQLYRLVTAAFLHAGALHLALNMFALAQLGPVLESSLGRARFLALYLLSALGGSTLAFLLGDPRSIGVGASGAIFGLFGAYYVVARRVGRETQSILVLLAVNLAATFLIPRIDWRAHLGGLIVGTLIAAGYAYAPRGPRRGQWQAGVCGLVAVVLVAAVAWRMSALAS